jgi:hypothetical protein
LLNKYFFKLAAAYLVPVLALPPWAICLAEIFLYAKAIAFVSRGRWFGGPV